jgi:hypothetical protein
VAAATRPASTARHCQIRIGRFTTSRLVIYTP